MNQLNPLRKTVFIVDDDNAVLDSLSMLMKSEKLDYLTYTSAQEFLDGYRDGQAGCLVLDVGMPGISGLKLQQHINESGTNLPIIFITGHGDVPMAVQAIQDGAVDFLQKPFSNDDLLKRIYKALALVDHSNDRRSSDNQQNYHKPVDSENILQSLTKREKEVLDCVVEGLPNKLTARKLNISQRTVETHRANIMHKLQINSVAELVRLALANAE